jgi:hypothetical protein
MRETLIIAVMTLRRLRALNPLLFSEVSIGQNWRGKVPERTGPMAAICHPQPPGGSCHRSQKLGTLASGLDGSMPLTVLLTAPEKPPLLLQRLYSIANYCMELFIQDYIGYYTLNVTI